ncbi:hypothetical protein [Methylobacterium fujisawaense]
MSTAAHTYGGVPVPYTVSWSAEDAFRVDHCQHANARAICQSVAPGQGKPQFGKPHSQRQREAIADDLCDLCGRTLRNKTKVSLSHARPRMNGANGLAILQVEPLLHRQCAATSLRHCPSLKRDVETGKVVIRQVTRHRVQFAIMSPEFVGTYVPGYVAGPKERIVGHAKVELLRWVDRDASWLLRTAEGQP